MHCHHLRSSSCKYSTAARLWLRKLISHEYGRRMRRIDQNDWQWTLFVLPVVLGTLLYVAWRWKFVTNGRDSYEPVQA